MCAVCRTGVGSLANSTSGAGLGREMPSLDASTELKMGLEDTWLEKPELFSEK